MTSNNKDQYFLMVKEKIKQSSEFKKQKKPIENSDIVFYNYFKDKRLTAESYIQRVKNLNTNKNVQNCNEKLDFIYDLKNKEIWKKIKKYKFFQW